MGRGGRIRALAALAGAGFGLATAVYADPAAASELPPPFRPPVAAPGWSKLSVLYPGGNYAYQPALAVGGGGRAVVAFVQGKPPPVTPYVSARRAAAPPTRYRQRLMVTLGSATGAFRQPVTLADRPAETFYTDLTGVDRSGDAFVAWSDGEAPRHSTRYEIAVARPGHRFAAGRRLALPPGAELESLTSGHDGPVFAVWNRSLPDDSELLQAAQLHSGGTLGRTITITRKAPGGADAVVVANDRGQLAAAWTSIVHDPDPAHSYVLVAAARAVVCTVHGTCPAAQTLALGPFPGGGALITLGNDGTATVLDGETGTPEVSDPAQPIDYGLWTTVSHPGAPFAAGHELSGVGAHPVATATGDGAVALFDVELVPVDTLELAAFPARGDTWEQPTEIPDHEVESNPTLAANDHGEFVAAWTDAQRPSGPDSLHVALGRGSALARARTVVPTNLPYDQTSVQAGVDDRGDTLMVWSGFGETGDLGIDAVWHRA